MPGSPGFGGGAVSPARSAPSHRSAEASRGPDPHHPPPTRLPAPSGPQPGSVLPSSDWHLGPPATALPYLTLTLTGVAAVTVDIARAALASLPGRRSRWPPTPHSDHPHRTATRRDGATRRHPARRHPGRAHRAPPNNAGRNRVIASVASPRAPVAGCRLQGAERRNGIRDESMRTFRCSGPLVSLELCGALIGAPYCPLLRPRR